MHLSHHARETPDKPALIMAGSGEVVTFAELDARSNRLARLFRDRGLAHRDGIALFMENNADYLTVLWAAQRAGLYYTALSSRLTPSEVEYIVNDCGAKALVTSAAMADVVGAVADLIPAVDTRLAVGGLDGFEDFDTAIEAYEPGPVDDEAEGIDMLYSSGTTGRPKGVRPPLPLNPVGTPSAVTILCQLLYSMDSESVYLSPAPLYHAAPLRFVMAAQRLGATAVVMEHFDPALTLELIETHRVTHAQFVPTMFVRLLRLPDEQRRAHDLSSLKVVIHAAAPCPIPVKEQMIEWWGPVINEYYAGTEGNGLCAVNSEEWLTHKGTVGRAVLGTVRIVGDDGEEVPTGSTGTVYFEGGSQFEYHNDPEKTARSRNDKGWTTLGDIGHVDEEGFLYLTDRQANMIITGGVNVYPQEAENVLASHPKVLDVAVFGVPNDDFGEEVKAVVQPVDMATAGPDLARELIAYCREQLAAVKCPRTVDFEAELPRHPTGKLYKRLLKDRYWEGRETRI